MTNLVNGYRIKGINHTEWDGTDSSGRYVSNGVYFAAYNYAGKQITRKMILMR